MFVGGVPYPNAIRRTTSPAAAKPKAPVMNTAVPNPVAQSNRRFEPASGSVEQVPSAQGYTGFSCEDTQGMP
jgi:hypothetical protein